jgi:hypothetical protein
MICKIQQAETNTIFSILDGSDKFPPDENKASIATSFSKCQKMLYMIFACGLNGTGPMILLCVFQPVSTCTVGRKEVLELWVPTRHHK